MFCSKEFNFFSLKLLNSFYRLYIWALLILGGNFLTQFLVKWLNNLSRVKDNVVYGTFLAVLR